MQPTRHQQRDLPAFAPGMPEHPDHVGIVGRMAVKLERQTRTHGMADQQGRDAEPECDAQQFERRQAAQAPVFVQSQESQGDVAAGGTV